MKFVFGFLTFSFIAIPNASPSGCDDPFDEMTKKFCHDEILICKKSKCGNCTAFQNCCKDRCEKRKTETTSLSSVSQAKRQTTSFSSLSHAKRQTKALSSVSQAKRQTETTFLSSVSGPNFVCEN